jgi:Fe/S biogenesis protein NfuA
MFTVTEAAQEKILERMEMEGKADRALRIRIGGWTADDFEYRLEVIPPEAAEPGDVQASDGKLPVFLAADSVERLEGATLNFVETAHERGFAIDNPNPVWTDAEAQAVQRVLDEHINPGVGMHGGRVMLMSYQDGVASIRFDGGCVGCGLSQVTLKQGVDKALKENVPGLKEVVDATNHAEGTNPYYAPEQADQAESPVA